MREVLYSKFCEKNNYKEDSERAKKEFEQLLRQLLSPKVKIHQGASYHSKFLPTKEITRLLQQNSQLILQQSKSSELISEQLVKIDKLTEEAKQEIGNSEKTSELVNCFLEKTKELTKELKEIIAANPNISEEGKGALKKIKKLRDELKV
jgi:methyl-accepting chemotaxis protein